MKTIIAAWIEQILVFTSEQEYHAYTCDLNRKKQRFKIIKYNKDISGEITLRIRKQYNNNAFPDETEEGI